MRAQGRRFFSFLVVVAFVAVVLVVLCSLGRVVATASTQIQGAAASRRRSLYLAYYDAAEGDTAQGHAPARQRDAVQAALSRWCVCGLSADRLSRRAKRWADVAWLPSHGSLPARLSLLPAQRAWLRRGPHTQTRSCFLFDWPAAHVQHRACRVPARARGPRV